MTSDSHDFQPSFFTLERTGEVAVIRIRKSTLSEEDNVEQLGFELMQIVDQLGYNRVVLSLKGVDWVTSSILGKLIHLHRHLRRLDGEMAICDLAPTVQEVMETSRLHTYFLVHSDVNTAVQQFQTQV